MSQKNGTQFPGAGMAPDQAAAMREMQMVVGALNQELNQSQVNIQVQATADEVLTFSGRIAFAAQHEIWLREPLGSLRVIPRGRVISIATSTIVQPMKGII